MIINEKIEEEKQKVTDNIDGILKQIIIVMDSVKDHVISKIDSYHKNVLSLRDFLFNQIEGFLQDTIRLVLKSETMEHFEKINGSHASNEFDPLNNELDNIRIQKEYAEGTERLFKNIRDIYKNAKVPDLKGL